MKYLGFIIVIITLSSCVSVKEYQKMYLNDKDMQLSDDKMQEFESSFISYREGASGANGGKSSGGCGCN
tara:strand:+ start:474 stop:680 length:207 start_codon:yes stop_codon:yes gene_type:complete